MELVIARLSMLIIEIYIYIYIYMYIYIYIYIFILVKDPADGLNNTVTAEGEFSINFSEQQNIFC